MNKRRVLCVVLSLLMVCCLCGCGGKRESAQTDRQEPTEVVLTERQKQILRDNGLPEDYDQLTISQQNGIEKIEDGLSYLEEKYHDDFEYYGYVPGGLDGEYLTALISDTLPEKYVTLYFSYVGQEYKFSDNYEAVMAEDAYVQETTDFLKGYFDPSDFQVYVEIYELQEKGDSVVERASGCPNIMINDVYSEKEIMEAAEAYAQWIAHMKNKKGGAAIFRVLKTEDYQECDEFNYKDYYGKDILVMDIDVDIDKDYSIKIRRQSI